MERFQVFAGDDYYPEGGGKDYQNSFGSRTIAEAYADGFVSADSMKWAHVFDAEEGEVIYAVSSKK
jgi:hypothetical protein